MVEELHVSIDNTYIHVIRFGFGKKNLLILPGVAVNGLEGMGEGVAHTYHILEEDYTVYLIEPRKDVYEGMTCHDMAEDAYQTARGFGITHAAIYGVSHGGMLAQTIALNHPEFVDQLILSSTMMRLTIMMNETVHRWMDCAKGDNIVNLNRDFFRVVYSPAFLNTVKDQLPELEKKGTKTDMERFFRLVKTMLTFDISSRVNEVKCPVFVIGDINDQVIGVEGSFEMIHAYHCQSKIYNQYSHAVYDECPEIVPLIKEFLTTYNTKTNCQ